jgi:hypothetical protein
MVPELPQIRKQQEATADPSTAAAEAAFAQGDSVLKLLSMNEVD